MLTHHRNLQEIPDIAGHEPHTTSCISVISIG
jgi:hypothetical protein